MHTSHVEFVQLCEVIIVHIFVHKLSHKEKIDRLEIFDKEEYQKLFDTISSESSMIWLLKKFSDMNLVLS